MLALGLGLTAVRTPKVSLPSLTANLVEYYQLDEAGGANNAVGIHSGKALTQVNSPGSEAGVINTARTFVSASTQYFTSSDAAFDFSDENAFTISAWVKLTNAAATASLVSKYQVNGAGVSYQTAYHPALGFRMLCYDAVGGIAGTVANNLVAISSGVYYHVLWWWNRAGNEMGVAVNGTPNTGTTFGDLGLSAPTDFAVGRAGAGYHNGAMDELALWNSVPTADMPARLYNSGAGLPYLSFN